MCTNFIICTARKNLAASQQYVFALSTACSQLLTSLEQVVIIMSQGQWLVLLEQLVVSLLPSSTL
jgi:hypothetical protein